MLLGTVQITGEELREAEVKDICNSLKDNSIRLLSLRGCHIQDEDFKKLMDSLKDNESLVQLNLNLGVCNGKHRIKWLTEAMMLNKSLGSLFLHGTVLGDEGADQLVPALEVHPKLQALDFGDCQLGDDGIRRVCTLLPPGNNQAELTELTLSANQKVTPAGWTQLAIAIAASSQLRSLYLDYNNITDFGAGVFAVAMAANSTLERIDFEGTRITDRGAELFFDVVANYPTKLQEIVLSENNISLELIEQISDCLAPNIENGSEYGDKNGERQESKAET